VATLDEILDLFVTEANKADMRAALEDLLVRTARELDFCGESSAAAEAIFGESDLKDIDGNSRYFDSDGKDCWGYDRDGYDRNGYTAEGFDRDGYSSLGYDRHGYNRDGYNYLGRDRHGNRRPVVADLTTPAV